MKFLVTYHKSLNSNIGTNNFYDNDKIKIIFETDLRNVHDSFYERNDRFLVVNIGVFFDNEGLVTTDRSTYYFNKIIALYETQGENFANDLRGCFCGVIYDVQNDVLLAYTDHSSCRRIFFTQQNNFILISSDIHLLTSELYNLNSHVSIDINGALMLLQNGFMLGESTLISEVSKLKPGTTLIYKKNNFNIHRYFDLNYTKVVDLSFEEAIDKFEELFVSAINLEFERDKVQKCKHLITLSGGLDSRAIRIIAHDLGFNNVININMSQSKYLDQIISQEISNYFSDDHVYFSLDNAKYLYQDIEKSVKNNGGTALYNGNAHMDYMLNNINISNFRILHTGMIGDAIAGGSFIRDDKIDISKGMYSSVRDQVNFNVNFDYSNQEMFLLYNRGINGAFNGIYSTQRKMEAFSAFIDPDFMTYNFSLPVKYRKNSKLYIAWMQKYHPLMLKFRWEKTGLKPQAPRLIVLFNRIKNGLIRRIFISNKLSMNPYDFWYATKTNFRNSIDEKFEYSQNHLSDFVELQPLLSKMTISNKVIDKLLIISLSYSINSLIKPTIKNKSR